MPSDALSNEEIRKLADEAMQDIPRRVRYFAPLVGVTFGRITIRNQKTRWGSYSFYSNNCVLGRFGGRPRVLIQASVPYFEARENVAHWWIDALVP